MSDRLLALMIVAALATCPSFAKERKSPTERDAPAVSPSDRREVVAALNKELRARYVYPEVGERMAKSLAEKSSHGAYSEVSGAVPFAEALQRDLRALGDDLHLRVDYAPRFQPEPDDNAPPTPEALEQMRAETAREGYGIMQLARLPGNVGYLDVRFFGTAELVARAYDAAISILDGTEALILDLRFNGGGEPSGVAELMSHFFAVGDTRHLNDLYWRYPKSVTREYWTFPDVQVRYTKPVYVLTAHGTFSGGEECAYDFQTQKRGTLVGEQTAGAANPGGPVSLGHGFIAFIPSGRAINPVTHTNWEHVGVKPDVAVDSLRAKHRAYLEALRTVVLPNAKNPEIRDSLVQLIDRVEREPPETTERQSHGP